MERALEPYRATVPQATHLWELLDPGSGEMLPATPDNAARLWVAVADAIAELEEWQREYVRVLVAEAQRQGTKTLHLPGHDVTVRGGPTVEYDKPALRANLLEVGCPPERVDAAAVPKPVAYRLNHSVLRQLAAANDDYRTAIELTKSETEQRWTATVKPKGATH